MFVNNNFQSTHGLSQPPITSFHVHTTFSMLHQRRTTRCNTQFHNIHSHQNTSTCFNSLNKLVSWISAIEGPWYFNIFENREGNGPLIDRLLLFKYSWVFVFFCHHKLFPGTHHMPSITVIVCTFLDIQSSTTF